MRGEKSEEELLDFLNEAINEHEREMNQSRGGDSKNLWEKSLEER